MSQPTVLSIRLRLPPLKASAGKTNYLFIQQKRKIIQAAHWPHTGRPHALCENCILVCFFFLQLACKSNLLMVGY